MSRKLLILMAIVFSVGSGFSEKLPIEPRAVQKFSFVVIADPHIGHNSKASRSLGQVVRKINSIRTVYNIWFVFLVGDITHNHRSSEFNEAIDSLSKLNANIYWIPLIGNHDIAYNRDGFDGTGKIFNSKFRNQYNYLANSLWIKNWKKQPSKRPDYKQNFSFDFYIWGHRFHFICLDWVARWNWGNIAVKDGTYDWYVNDIRTCFHGQHNIFMFAHHPCKYTPWLWPPGGFYWPNDYNHITSWMYGYRFSMGKWFNGHLHYDEIYDIYYPWYPPQTYVCDGSTTNNTYEGNGNATLVQVYESGTILISKIYGERAIQKFAAMKDSTTSDNYVRAPSGRQAVGDKSLISTKLS